MNFGKESALPDSAAALTDDGPAITRRTKMAGQRTVMSIIRPMRCSHTGQSTLLPGTCQRTVLTALISA